MATLQILKGGFIVAADLVRALDPCPEDMVIEFIHVRRDSGAAGKGAGRMVEWSTISPVLSL